MADSWRATRTGSGWTADPHSRDSRLWAGTPGARGGWRLAADGIRSTKDRDAPALEVRMGRRVWGAQPGMLQG